MVANPGAAPVWLGSPRFNTLDCGAFMVTDALFPAGHRLDKHFHDRTVVGLTLRGEWDSVLGSTCLSNSPGMMHVEPAGDSHLNQFGSGGAHVVVIQPNPTHEMFVHPFRALLESAVQLQLGMLGILIAERLENELMDRDDLSPLAIESLSTDLLIAGSRWTRLRSGSQPVWLLRAADYLHEQFLQRPSLAELSNVAGVSPEHFNREFRRVYRTGPAEYIRYLRLSWAAERLRGHCQSVAEIASAAGFADQSHFTRHFRKHFGVTPAAFRSASAQRR
jgi:AraC family transcriptional regulator